MYNPHIRIEVRPAIGNGWDLNSFRAVFINDDELYGDLEAFGPSPSIALAKLEDMQARDLLESMNMLGADNE